jgi:hypothetical protein
MKYIFNLFCIRKLDVKIVEGAGTQAILLQFHYFHNRRHGNEDKQLNLNVVIYSKMQGHSR